MLLEVKSASKSYPGVKALDDVNFTLEEGQVHALIGENGAGKSTLANIIGGVVRPDCGKMTLAGSEYNPHSTHEAQTQGVRMVMQELNILDTLSVAENIFLNSMPALCGFINFRDMNNKAFEVMKLAGLESIDPAAPAAKLSIGQKQMVEIAGGFSKQCKIFILDEPTSSLTDRETELLFDRIRYLKKHGVGIIYISHKMNEIKSIADKVTVLRDGRNIITNATDKLSIHEMVSSMVGRTFSGQQFDLPKINKECVLEVKNLCKEPKVKNISFSLHKGEILGFAGLIGSGRTETMRCIFGADKLQSGQIILNNEDITAQLVSPRKAIAKSLALIPESRKSEGLLLSLSVANNISMGNYNTLSSCGFVKAKKEQQCAKKHIELLKIKCSSQQQKTLNLSGGNQQKVILARWICRDSDILIFDEPTRGIDIAARFEIYKLMVKLAAKGKSVIIASSDLQELQTICHRIAVMSGGKLIQIFNRENWSEKEIMAAAFKEHIN